MYVATLRVRRMQTALLLGAVREKPSWPYILILTPSGQLYLPVDLEVLRDPQA